MCYSNLNKTATKWHLYSKVKKKMFVIKKKRKGEKYIYFFSIQFQWLNLRTNEPILHPISITYKFYFFKLYKLKFYFKKKNHKAKYSSALEMAFVYFHYYIIIWSFRKQLKEATFDAFYLTIKFAVMFILFYFLFFWCYLLTGEKHQYFFILFVC